MLNHRAGYFVGSMVLVAVVGCHDREIQTVTTQMHDRMDDAQKGYGTQFSYMADNAVLHDMAINDTHFIPHTAEISGVGEVHLNRMARLLNVYGGKVHYTTYIENADLVERRMDHVREYLSLAGTNMDRVEVAVGLPGGSGMPADEAVKQYREGTAPQAGGGGVTFVPAGGAGQ